MNGTSLDSVLAEMGDVGLRMSQIDAAEGAAGNMSVYLAGEIELSARFRRQSRIALPVAVPHLADGWVAVTGGSRRLRDVAQSPETIICLLHMTPDGQHATLYAAQGVRPTSELNTHLAVHNDHVGRRALEQHAILHAQPVHLTYLSHVPRYQDTLAFNRRLLRWQPETIIVFPEGIGVLPFQVPGSAEQMAVTTSALATHRGIIWTHHGIVTRADSGIGRASDLVEYAEAAAHYEYLNLAAGEPSTGLSDEELRLICDQLKIQQTFF